MANTWSPFIETTSKMTKGSSQGFSKPILVVFYVLYFCIICYVSYPCRMCIKISYFLYISICIKFHLYMLKKKKFIFMYFISKKAKIFFGISSWHIFIIYMELRHFCLHAGTRDSLILRHSFWSIDQASTCPTVGARCYQIFCTIVGLPEELPVDRFVQSLISVYQLIRLHV